MANIVGVLMGGFIASMIYLILGWLTLPFLG